MLFVNLDLLLKECRKCLLEVVELRWKGRMDSFHLGLGQCRVWKVVLQRQRRESVRIAKGTKGKKRELTVMSREKFSV